MGIFSGIGKAVSSFLGGPIPGLIGTGLELFGGAKGAFGRSQLGPGRTAYAQLMGAAKAADELGLHRSLVAGSPAGYSPAPMSQAEGALMAGQQLRQGGRDKKADELIDAQIEEARSRTVLNQANARRALSGPQPGLGGVGGFASRVLNELSRHQGGDGGPRRIEVLPEDDKPLTDTVVAGGVPMRGLRDPIDVSEIIGSLLWYGPQYITGIRPEQAPKEDRVRRSRRRNPNIRPNQPGYRP